MSWHVSVRTRVGALELDVDLTGNNRPTVLIGPNGSGKTTLLRTIAGALNPRAGSIEVSDRALFDSRRGIDVPPEQRRVGYLPQGYGLFPHLSVVDNVAFGLRHQNRGERRQRALSLLEQLGCLHLAERTPRALSGGEQQRVALARALAVEPHMLLLDEPLAALDPASRRSLRELLAAQVAERPALLVTHDHRDVNRLDAHVAVLDCGHIVQTGTAEELRAQPGSNFVAEFFDAS